MSKAIPQLAIILSLITQLLSQPLPQYYNRSSFLLAPPGSFNGGLVGFSNPANLALLPEPEMKFFWSNDGTKIVSIQDWGIFSGVRGLGFSLQKQNLGVASVTDYKLSTASGNGRLAFGFGYGWSVGKDDASGRVKHMTVGSIFRPSQMLSMALVGNQSFESSDREIMGELGVRPFRQSNLTLFADAALHSGMSPSEAPWSLGAAGKFTTGVYIVGRYFRGDQFTLGLTFSLGKNVVGGQARLDKNEGYYANSYFMRIGAPRPSLLTHQFSKSKYYVPMGLKGRIDYLKFKYFDNGVKRLLEVLQDLNAAQNDPRVNGVAINLAGMKIRPEHSWELRKAIEEVQAAGKKVLIFIEKPGMTSYHLASVADILVCDPQGLISLPGYSLGRTYFKGTMEKLGLGFDEWRFFKYKSANESFSREEMSEADREQSQAFVDDWYVMTRQGICKSRGLQPAQFDSLVDHGTHFPASEAYAAGLVDTLARWPDIEPIMARLTKRKPKRLRARELFGNSLSSDIWGRKDKIAVVYALGICAMDEGIRARQLERIFRGLTKSPSIKAVVLRVDSPGGDGMASDVLAQATRRCAAVKPVIVSQGQVAASGGYWISAFGDKILAGPTTITGSIGVIWGWVYDQGFGSKLGMTSDFVSRGAHAELARGIHIPFIPYEVPARNVTPEERNRAEKIIRQHYDEFVGRVAQGRHLEETRVREIAEGRIYSGLDGKDIGLVDEIGGLLDAIEVAKKQAGLADKEVEIIEIPSSKGWFNFQNRLSPLSAELHDDENMQFIKLMLENKGAPLPVLVPGTYPDYE